MRKNIIFCFFITQFLQAQDLNKLSLFDCIKLAISRLAEQKPDLIVSGINHGSNTAINIIYSGTVSAAREAAIMDVPAIAVSITSHEASNFEYASEIAKNVCLMVAKKGLKIKIARIIIILFS